MFLDFADDIDRYKVMSQTVIPRPIAWIVTEDGNTNVAPFSYFTPLSSDPAVLIVSIGTKADGSPKDSIANLRKTKKATICIPHQDQLQDVHFCSKPLDKGQSEAEYFNIELERIVEDFPPMIKGAPAAYFCEYYDEVKLPSSSSNPTIVEVKYLHVDDRYVTNAQRHYFRFTPLARTGIDYGMITEFEKGPQIP